MTITLKEIRAAFGALSPRTLPDPPKVWQRAAVAMTFAGEADELHLCFIKRTERDGDRWSGHMAFPGGRGAHEDEDAVATAIREAREEVGLRLEAAERLGQLDELSLDRRGGSSKHGVLSPYSFYAGRELMIFEPEPKEVARAYWVPLAKIWDPSAQTELHWQLDGGREMAFPGIAHDGEVIWGLTYHLLRQFSEHVGRGDILPPIPQLPEHIDST